MKQNNFYWSLFAPMIKSSIKKRFGAGLADQAIHKGKGRSHCAEQSYSNSKSRYWKNTAGRQCYNDRGGFGANGQERLHSENWKWERNKVHKKLR